MFVIVLISHIFICLYETVWQRGITPPGSKHMRTLSKRILLKGRSSENAYLQETFGVLEKSNALSGIQFHKVNTSIYLSTLDHSQEKKIGIIVAMVTLKIDCHHLNVMTIDHLISNAIFY